MFATMGNYLAIEESLLGWPTSWQQPEADIGNPLRNQDHYRVASRQNQHQGTVVENTLNLNG
jgi:hypothetical protein